MISRNEIVTAARRWIGTPYKHQASLKGVGADCLGLVRGVWRDIYGQEPERAPVYTSGWDDHDPQDILLKKAFQHLTPVDLYQAGDVLVFRMAIGGPAKHMAIAVGNGRMVHAITGSACSEVNIGNVYKRRLVQAFEFPQGAA